MNTVKKGYMDKLVSKAEEERKADIQKKLEDEFIEVHDDIYKMIKVTPVINSKHFHNLTFSLPISFLRKNWKNAPTSQEENEG